MRKFGLIGYPLSHSFSPAYFAEKFAKENISDCSYQTFPIKAIEELKDLLKDSSIEGLNVTIPHKKQIVALLHEQADEVKETGACNCVKIVEGKLIGYNTDVTGFEHALKSGLTAQHTNALVLGTGGAAAAVEFVLNKLTIDYKLVSRSPSAHQNSIGYGSLDKEILQQHKLILNTTPVGLYPDVDVAPTIPYHYLTRDHYLFDLIYNPEQTLFLKKGAEQGAFTKNGAEMLIIQAEESWKIWNEERKW